MSNLSKKNNTLSNQPLTLGIHPWLLLLAT